jgi:uncharacterized protein (DUF2062 family)
MLIDRMTAFPEPQRASFWQRRVVAPLLVQLTQGVTPDKLAATLAVGTACSLLPFLGFTSLLNLLVGVALRMNQPVLQSLNQLLGPLQLVLILGYLRLGEIIWRDPAMPFTVSGMVETFGGRTLVEFLRIFGRAGLHALTAWALTAPLLVAALYFLLRPAMRRLASLRTARP